MAEIIYRLPGREQYSYAEVTFSSDELFGPDALSGEARVELLKEALADLDQTYPVRENPGWLRFPDHLGADSVPSASACIHGERKHASGKSTKGPWQALFCTQPKGSQCEAKWLKAGDPGWIN